MRNPPADPATLLLRSVLALGRRLRAERPPGSLSLSGLGLLGTLHRRGTLAATRLAELENLRPQSLTRLLADLESEKLIKRTRSEVDRRSIEIVITAKGRQALIDDMSVRRAWLDASITGALTQNERALILSAAPILAKLAAHESIIAPAEWECER